MPGGRIAAEEFISQRNFNESGNEKQAQLQKFKISAFAACRAFFRIVSRRRGAVFFVRARFRIHGGQIFFPPLANGNHAGRGGGGMAAFNQNARGRQKNSACVAHGKRGGRHGAKRKNHGGFRRRNVCGSIHSRRNVFLPDYGNAALAQHIARRIAPQINLCKSGAKSGQKRYIKTPTKKEKCRKSVNLVQSV